MNICMLCHFDQREKYRVSKDEISRCTRNDKMDVFLFFEFILFEKLKFFKIHVPQ